MSRVRVWFLEGLPTITSIVEGFGGVPSKLTIPLFEIIFHGLLKFNINKQTKSKPGAW